MTRKPKFITEHPVSFGQALALGFTRGTCLHVVDGDTVDVFLDLGWYQYTYETIRLAGVSAAEIRGTRGRILKRALKAKDRVTELVYDKCVLVRSQKDSLTFGRFVAEVYVEASTSSHLLQTTVIGSSHWASISDVLTLEQPAGPPPSLNRMES